METTCNVVVLRGRLTSEPMVRELPSGGTVTQLELTMRHDGVSISVPVAVHGQQVTVMRDDEVVVTGHVARRFFRAGGVTQSRTEVIASRVLRASRRKSVERALAEAVRMLEQDDGRVSDR